MSDPSNRLSLLRAALDALSTLGEDLPDVARLRTTWEALDPAISGETFAHLLTPAPSGLPTQQAVNAVVEQRRRLAEAAIEVADEAIVRTTGAGEVAAEFARRLLAERTFRRYLRRAEPFPGTSEVRHGEDGPHWTWDAVLADGRVGRIRVVGDAVRRPLPGDAWFSISLDDLDAEVGYDGVRRCILGPVYHDASGEPAGLFALREATGEKAEHRLAVDRLRSEDVPPGVLAVPFALADGARVKG